jgi:anaphase-promoting complex subunit 11
LHEYGKCNYSTSLTTLVDLCSAEIHTDTTTMKVSIKKWNAVATWRWDLPEDDVCGICQVQFDGTCPTCKYPGDDCSLCKLSIHPPLIFIKELDLGMAAKLASC